MPHRLVAGIGLGAAAMLLVIAGAPVSAAGERQFLYLATADSTTGTDLFELTQTPTGQPAPFGVLSVTTVGSRMTLHLDDAGTPDGQAIPVRIYDGDWRVFGGCVRVRTRFTVAGLRANQQLGVSIGEHVTDPLLAREELTLLCSSNGTSGVATISGVK